MVISGYRIGERAETFRSAPQSENVTFKLVRRKGVWKITEPTIAPHVGKAALAAFLGEPPATTMTCTAKHTFKDGSRDEHELTLEITKGRPSRIAYSNTMSNGQEGGAYTCELEAAEGSADTEWVRAGSRTRVTEPQLESESYFEIEALPHGSYRVNFETISTTAHCGFGAEFPKAIVIKPGIHSCAVER
jgi:hypothetical protein